MRTRSICFRYIGLIALSILLFTACNKSDTGSIENVQSPSGKGGSLARFTVSGNYLYAVDASRLITYSIEQAGNPQQVKASEVGFDIETIFPYKDKLFVGSGEAMYVFSIANPANPVKIGMVSHIRACDPVVAHDSIAYVTVRSGSACGGSLNALYVYDISNPQNPMEMNMLNMVEPYGLGWHEGYLYVCDGRDGLKVYTAGTGTYQYELTYTTSVAGARFYDCIPYENLLIAMVEGGVILYDISQPAAPEELSRIMY